MILYCNTPKIPRSFLTVSVVIDVEIISLSNWGITIGIFDEHCSLKIFMVGSRF